MSEYAAFWKNAFALEPLMTWHGTTVPPAKGDLKLFKCPTKSLSIMRTDQHVFI